MKVTSPLFVMTHLMFYISAVYSSDNVTHNSTEQLRRAANTCGDPSLATTYFEAYSPSLKVHGLNIQAQFVVVNANFGGDWQIATPSFQAWTSPGQLSTVPLYSLFNPTTTDIVYMISTNGAPPTLSGFEAPNIAAYVYPTQICGSVPLYSVSLPSGANGDHWYTTDLAEHDALVSRNGVDAGIVAYVLKIADCGCT